MAGPTMSPSTRNAAPKVPTRGPSWTRRTSWTLPTSPPAASTTRLCSSSLRRTSRSRDPSDEVVARPVLEPRQLQVVLGHGQTDRGGDLLDHAEGDAGRTWLGEGVEPAVHRLEPLAHAAPQPTGQRARAGQDGGHHRRPVLVALGHGQLQVVDLARQSSVAVEDLPVEQAQTRVQASPWAHDYCPALVTIIKGMAAADATRTMIRKIDPKALANRPLVLPCM